MTSVATELSAVVCSVPVVMIFFNVPGKYLVPEWIATVDEIPREPIDHNQPSGRKLVEGKRVVIEDVLDDIEKNGFVPLRLVVIKRMQGINTRMALVCVRKDQVKNGERRLLRRDEAHVRGQLLNRLWDTRVFRNPGATGGNFVVECGNPKRADAESTADLRIDDTTLEFELLTGDEFEE